MKVADYVMDFLAERGVQHVFMLPGGGAMHLNDSLGRHKKLKYVCNLHEQASAVAAEAYGQYSGLGVLIVTTGPGGTNVITGVAGAWLESTPLIIISGQVKRVDLVGGSGVRQRGFQEINIIKIVSSITKFARTVMDPLEIREVLEQAIWKAQNGRKGPVWIDIPLDVQAAEIDPESLEQFVPPVENEGIENKIRIAAAETTSLLLASKRPAILAGNGIRQSGALELFLKWAESVEVPILTTWKALDFLPDSHPLFAGRPGAVGQRSANFTQQNCDLFISIGARLDFGQTAYNHSNFAPKARRVVVDVDPNEIDKLKMDLAVRLEADAGGFIRAMEAETAGRKFPDWTDWRSRIKNWRQRYPVVLPAYGKTKRGINNYIFVDALGRRLGQNDLLVPGSSGACSEVTCQALPVGKGLRFINTQGLGAMGFGIPAAMGSCIASGLKRTISIDGDGGFPMNSQELNGIGKRGLPIIFFVLNNGGYGSIRATQINYFGSRFVGCDDNSGLFLPDIEKLAVASGIPYRRMENQETLGEQLDEVLSAPLPVICEVIMAPDQFTQPKVSSRQTADGKMVTLPMENMWPFLRAAELKENMSD
jgi:acetolactate synthase-1/2/3 large subunit